MVMITHTNYLLWMSKTRKALWIDPLMLALRILIGLIFSKKRLLLNSSRRFYLRQILLLLALVLICSPGAQVQRSYKSDASGNLTNIATASGAAPTSFFGRSTSPSATLEPLQTFAGLYESGGFNLALNRMYDP